MKAQKRHAIVIVNMKYNHMLLGFFFSALHNPLPCKQIQWVAHDSFNSEDLVNVTLLDAFLFLLLVKHIHVLLSDLIQSFFEYTYNL